MGEGDEEKDGDNTNDASPVVAAGSQLEGAASLGHLSRDESTSPEPVQPAGKDRRKQLAKQGSVLSNYFGSGPRG